MENMVKCLHCKTAFEPDDERYINYDKNKVTLEFECPECYSTVLVTYEFTEIEIIKE